MSYNELKEKQQQEVNAFPLMFAFGQKQFDEMLEKNNVTAKEIYSIGAGGYVRKTDAQAMSDMFKRHSQELTEARKQNKFLQESFLYEMANHEYCITFDREEVLCACGLTESDYQTNADVRKAWKAARNEYANQVEVG
jgi:hypothetical protein